MKRVGYLLPQIANVDNLMAAYYNARRGKLHKSSVIAYGANLNDNILKLREELLNGVVEVGDYTYFEIRDPKRRTICAASFKERVLHHAIINVCKPYFERHLIDDTYATRDGKGIYAAIDRARSAMKRYAYVAKLDVRKYFDSIDHSVLKEKLRRLFKDNQLLSLLDSIIDSYHTEPGKGIPIGNLTSQYFANYYLSSMDHFVKEKLRVPMYVRYMDDMLLLGTSREQVKAYVAEVNSYISNSLLLHIKTPQIVKENMGVSFLGYRLFANKLLINRRSKLRFCRRFIECEQCMANGRWSEQEYLHHITPLLAFVQKAYTRNLRLNMLYKCAMLASG